MSDGVTFSRPAFESAVAKHSPLLPKQFDIMLGEITSENKSIAWAIMRVPHRDQSAIWQMFTVVKAHCPAAIVSAVR